MDGFQDIARSLILTLPLMWLSLSFHEAAHAYVANRCGDPTARLLGRISLNPMVHIDFLGTVVVPIIATIFSGFALIGWAKPVPVDPRNLRNWRRDDIMISLAGPASNLLLALVFSVITMVVVVLMPQDNLRSAETVFTLLERAILMNVGLAVFNMIPIPPLDGSHVVGHYLPASLRPMWQNLAIYGSFVLLLLINIPFVRGLLGAVIYSVAQIFFRIATIFQ